MFLEQEIRHVSASLTQQRCQLREHTNDIQDIVHEKITSPTVMIGSFVAGMGIGSLGSGSTADDCSEKANQPHQADGSRHASQPATADVDASLDPQDADRRVAEALAESSSYQKHEWMRTLTRILAAPVMSYVLTRYGPVDDDSSLEHTGPAT